MKKRYVTVSAIALAVSCSLTNAMPFTPSILPSSFMGDVSNQDVAPIVEPALIIKQRFKTPFSTASLRGYQPLFKEESGRLPLALRALPMQPPLQFASLSILSPVPGLEEQHSPLSLAPVEKQLPKAKWAKLMRSTLAPMAFVRYCNQNKSKCASKGASQIELSDAMFTLLDSVNRDVNREIHPRNESKDVWRDNVRYGDCEDYALTKRAKLVEMGFSAAALRMAVAKTPQGEGHAVLVVSTNRGDFVLDNRNNEVRPFQRSDLTWVKMQGSKGPLLWHRI